MNIEKTLISILKMPCDFHTEHKSMYTLLKETGYASVHDHISADAIRGLLSKYPEYVSSWMQYSEDKRTTSGWYFIRSISGKFVVGYLGAYEHEKYYGDKLTACSIFVKYEIDSILNG